MTEQTRPRVAFHTLGCKVNQQDSAVMAALFIDAGYQVVPFHDWADVYVVNTCTVTHLSDRKSRQMIRRAHTENPDAVIAVCGCYAQVAADQLQKFPEIDVILGTNMRHRVVEAVENFRRTRRKGVYLATEAETFHYEDLPHERVSGMTRAYVKIQEGCDQFCRYCIIPYARGPLRSRTEEDTLAEIRDLVAAGYKEVILTGIHIGAYGRGREDKAGSLTHLCQRIMAETDLARLRLGSVEATEIDDDMIDLIAANPRMARHLHLPLQSGCDATLARMHRPYDTAFFRDKVRQLRQRLPYIAITTDLMVGFPGETDEEFKASLKFCNDIEFSAMHIFKYSMRKGTPAADMDCQVDPQIKDRRARQMADVAQKNQIIYAKRFLDHDLSVLVEEETAPGVWSGHSSNYLHINVLSHSLQSGQIADVHLSRIEGSTLYGEPVKVLI